MKKYLLMLFVGTIILPTVLFAQNSTNADIDPQGSSNCLKIVNDLRYLSTDSKTNNEVSALQDFLQNAGYLQTSPTGFFGLMTLSSVKKFQSSNNISPTGFVGPLTRAKINSLSCGTTTVIPVTTTTTTTTRSSNVPGCVAGANFSSTTGAPCLNTAANIITTPQTFDGTVSSPTQKITVKTPSAGDIWYENNAYTISWSPVSGDFDSYAVMLSNKLVPGVQGGGPVFTSGSKNKTSVSFDPRDLSSNLIQTWLANSKTDYLVKGTVSEQDLRNNFFYTINAVKNTSDGKQKIVASGVSGIFSILPTNVNTPNLTVTYPQTGFSLSNGGKSSIATITWSSSSVGNYPIEIDLLNTSGSIVKTIATGLQNTGSYLWGNDTSISSGNYIILVSSQTKEGSVGSAAGRSGIFSIVTDNSSASQTPTLTSSNYVLGKDTGTVSGYNLSKVNYLYFNSTSIGKVDFTYISDSQISFKMPSTYPGNYSIYVATIDQNSNQINLNIAAPSTQTPILNSANYVSGKDIGSVSGSNLSAVYDLYFNGSAIGKSNLTYVSDSQVSFVMPTTNPGNYPISVVTTSQKSNQIYLNISAPASATPILSLVNYVSGKDAGSVSGSNLSKVNYLYFNGTAIGKVDFTYISDSQISFKMPTTNPGNYSIYVTTIDQKSNEINLNISPTATQALSISITYPNGGEVFQIAKNGLNDGRMNRITWISSSNIDTVSIGFSIGPGSLNWIANSIPNTGYYDWPAYSVDERLIGKQIKIYILGGQTGVGQVDDYSDNYFTAN